MTSLGARPERDGDNRTDATSRHASDRRLATAAGRRSTTAGLRCRRISRPWLSDLGPFAGSTQVVNNGRSMTSTDDNHGEAVRQNGVFRPEHPGLDHPSGPRSAPAKTVLRRRLNSVGARRRVPVSTDQSTDVGRLRLAACRKWDSLCPSLTGRFSVARGGRARGRRRGVVRCRIGGVGCA